MISVIIPAWDEAETLEQLHRELSDVASARGYELQMIMVDDGSTDGTWSVVEELARRDRRVLGIRFRRNFGKAAGLSAGFDAATGDTIVTIDADLQDSPVEIPKLLAKLHEGLDVVSGWKVDRRDPWHKRWPSKGFNWLVGWLTGVKLHDHNASTASSTASCRCWPRRAVFASARSRSNIGRGSMAVRSTVGRGFPRVCSTC
jgi:glycosyltransferase involved in cell wall biosynthesis